MKTLLFLTGMGMLLGTTGCLVSDGGRYHDHDEYGHGDGDYDHGDYNHAGYGHRGAIIVSPPVLVVQPPVVIVR